ncbi:MAG: hypothetical protein ABFS41_05660 [Myxococcota bacterium]
MLDRETWSDLAFGLAFVATVLLVLEWALWRRGAGHRLRRVRDGLLASVGLLAALVWWAPLWVADTAPAATPALRGVHMRDAFHYYVGPKYFRELGFTRLYECSAAAEVERGGAADVAKRIYRDLETNRPVPGRSVVARARSCRDRFTPGAWKRFVHDVDWFRQRTLDWGSVMLDWGYNATPVWNALGATIVGTRPVTERQLLWLTRLDAAVLLACAALIGWAFGWRTLSVASIFWGTNLANVYGWTGGSILRQEWLLASIAGVCFLRKQWPLAAGAALTYAATLSIFPGFLAAGIGLKAVAEWIEARRISFSRSQRRLLLGAALTLAVALPAAVPSGGTPAAWAGFVTNSRIDSAPSPNNMGLPALLSYDRNERLRTFELVEGAKAADSWTEAREKTLAARRPLHVGLVLGFVWLAAGAARRQPDWIAALLGLGFVVFAFELSCYYYAFMLLFGLLWPRHRSLGIALCGIAAASLWIGERWPDDEDLYMWLSLLAVVYVGTTAAVLRFPRAEPA